MTGQSKLLVMAALGAAIAVVGGLYFLQEGDDPLRQARDAPDDADPTYDPSKLVPSPGSGPTREQQKAARTRRAKLEREKRAWLKLDNKRLGQLNDELTQVLADFQAATPETRARFAGRLEHLSRVLGPRMTDSSKEALLSMLTTIEPPENRYLLGRCLAQLEGDEPMAQRVAGTILDGESMDNRSLLAATHALSGMQVESVVPSLLDGIDLADKERAALIVQAIGGIGGEVAERGLLALLSDQEVPRNVRTAVIATWSETAPAASYDRVAAALATGPDYAKEALVSILGRSGDARHTGAVIQALEASQDRRLKESAIRSLGRIGDPKAAAHLLRIVEENRPETKSAERALRDLRSPETLKYVAKSWDSLGAEGRRAVLRAATRADAPPTEMMALAERSLEDTEVRVRVTAAGALGRKGNTAGIKPLANYLSRAQTDRELLAGIQALRKIGTPEAARVALDRMSGMEIKGTLKTYKSLLEKQAEG